ncbi:MAG: zf-HC2 domain-containing protein [Candidatus Omnitrophica bacterium]|nr:zf-HC2 domain-containing protein [Candidatus Omnitrophota bacterium]
MDCSEVRKIIPEYVSHAISEEETTKVEEHLCICDACRQFLNKLIDNPSKSAISKPIPSEEPTNKKLKLFSFFDYVILAIGVVVLLFFIYLILKG